MEKYTFTKEQIEAVLDEIERRLQLAIEDAYDCGIESVAVKEIRECRADMMQGVYGTLMVLSKNWSEVVFMVDRIAEGRNWYGYPTDQF